MTVHGHVENGVVVLDDSVELPEGARVRVEVEPHTAAYDSDGRTLGEKLLRFAGRAVDLPADAAADHDRYLDESGGE